MALVLKDRVQETATANTTVSFSLAGAVTGFQTFSSAIGNANTTYYSATDISGNWEVGLGTYATTGNLLTRTTIYSSSNAGLAVTFSGTVTVFVTYPATQSVYEDASNVMTDYALTGGSINNTPIGATTANTGSFTTWTASGVITANTTTNSQTYTTTGAGTITITSGTAGNINNMIIGATTPAAGTFTNISSATAPTNTVPTLSLTGTPNASTGGKAGVLSVGPNFAAADKNILATFIQNINDYTQIIVQNQNAGATASADFVVNNDNTTGAGIYGDFGINSTGYTGTGSFNLASAVYMYANNSDLVIGTRASFPIRFVTNNATTDAMSISSAGAVTLGTPLALGSGGTGKTTAPAANAELTGFTTTATAGGTTTLTNTSSFYQVFTGTSAQTVQLPATSTLAQGWSFHIVNNSTNILTLNTSTSVTLGTISPGATVMPTALTTSGNTAADWEFGYTDFAIDARQIPQNSQSGNYTLAFSDIGEHIYHPVGAGAAIYTIPANASVPFEIGTAFTFINMSTTAPTIAITSDILYLAGTGTTGTRTLAQFGVATAIKMTATTWIISGSGLT